MGAHRAHARGIHENAPLYQAMRTIGIEKFAITLHHLFACNSKDELHAEEDQIMNGYIAAGVHVYNDKINGKNSDEANKKTSDHFKGIIGDKARRFDYGSIQYDPRKDAWIFEWRDPNRKSKSFALKKHGVRESKQMAEAVRLSVYPKWVKDPEEAAIDDLMMMDI
jgi:hypothetical protein